MRSKPSKPEIPPWTPHLNRAIRMAQIEDDLYSPAAGYLLDSRWRHPPPCRLPRRPKSRVVQYLTNSNLSEVFWQLNNIFGLLFKIRPSTATRDFKKLQGAGRRERERVPKMLPAASTGAFPQKRRGALWLTGKCHNYPFGLTKCWTGARQGSGDLRSATYALLRVRLPLECDVRTKTPLFSPRYWRYWSV